MGLLLSELLYRHLLAAVIVIESNQSLHATHVDWDTPLLDEVPPNQWMTHELQLVGEPFADVCIDQERNQNLHTACIASCTWKGKSQCINTRSEREHTLAAEVDGEEVPFRRADDHLPSADEAHSAFYDWVEPRLVAPKLVPGNYSTGGKKEDMHK